MAYGLDRGGSVRGRGDRRRLEACACCGRRLMRPAPERAPYHPDAEIKQINRARGIAVDPANNFLAVGNRDPLGILIFKLDDQGDVAPRAIITGPNTGIYATKGFTVNPERKELIAVIACSGILKGVVDQLHK